MLNEIFERHNLRLTKPRQQVFDILRNSDVPLTVGDIAKNCKNINRASIYRTLLMFDNLNIIKHHNYWLEELLRIGGTVYTASVTIYIALICQNAEPIQSQELEKLIDLIGKKHNFIVTKHHFELEGICEKCRHIIENK